MTVLSYFFKSVANTTIEVVTSPAYSFDPIALEKQCQLTAIPTNENHTLSYSCFTDYVHPPHSGIGEYGVKIFGYTSDSLVDSAWSCVAGFFNANCQNQNNALPGLIGLCATVLLLGSLVCYGVYRYANRNRDTTLVSNNITSTVAGRGSPEDLDRRDEGSTREPAHISPSYMVAPSLRLSV